MGISDFYDLIKENCPEVLVEIKLTELSGIRIAVDISIFLNKYVKTAGPERWKDSFTIFLCKLKKHGIKPVCIFDGPNPPAEKKREQNRRRAEGAKIKEKIEHGKHLLEQLQNLTVLDEEPPQELIDDVKTILGARRGRNVDTTNYDDVYDIISGLRTSLSKKEKQVAPILPEYTVMAKELIEAMGFAYFQAEGEAETLCATMCCRGQVDAVLSEDTDVLAYGSPYLLSKIDLANDKVCIISHQAILEALELNHEEFLDLCILLSCDYNNRVKGFPPDGRKYKKPVPIGVKKAYTMIKEYRRLEKVEEYLEDPDPLNYRRCRVLFSIPKHIPDITVPCNKPIDEDAIIRFLKKYKVRTSIDYILSCWTPPEIDFGEDEVLSEEAEEIFDFEHK